MDKTKKLAEIAREIENCEICKVGKSGKAVPGEGNPNAKVVFVGEAPGRTESLTGRPFVGRSGKYLRSKIAEIGLKDEDVFITSPVKYLPDRGTPSLSDIEHGRIHLLKQLNIIQPKIVVLMGAVACYGVLHQKISTVKMHGSVINKERSFQASLILRYSPIYFITVHPAAALRFPKLRKIFEIDFRKLKLLLISYNRLMH